MITLQLGATLSLVVTARQPKNADGEKLPINLTGFEVDVVKSTFGPTRPLTLTIEDAEAGRIRVRMDDEHTARLTPNRDYQFAIRITTPNGDSDVTPAIQIRTGQ